MSDSAEALSGKVGTAESATNMARAKLARAAERLAEAAGSALPPLVLMTDDERLPDPLAAAAALPQGSLVIVRSRDALRRQSLGLALREIARTSGLFLSIAGDVALARRLNADGVHLSEAEIGARPHGVLVTASAHALTAIRRAHGVDALILSAVFPTASHPGRAALGVARANAMARLAPLPVYALGGIAAENAGRLAGFCGIAAIGALAV